MQHCINLGDIQLLRLHLGEDGESIKMQVYVKKGGGAGGGYLQYLPEYMPENESRLPKSLKKPNHLKS